MGRISSTSRSKRRIRTDREVDNFDVHGSGFPDPAPQPGRGLVLKPYTSMDLIKMSVLPLVRDEVHALSWPHISDDIVMPS